MRASRVLLIAAILVVAVGVWVVAARNVGGDAAGAALAVVDAASPAPSPCEGIAGPPTKGEGPRKVAFLVGIESYGDARGQDLPADEQWSVLRGPRYDLAAMAALLAEQGFEVECLFDRAATREAILTGWRKYLRDRITSKEDVALFYFSGHGYQITDIAPRDEADGLDEVLVPYDHRGHDPAAFLRDDELREVAAEVEKKSDNLVVVLDSCHSGSATRGPLASRGKKSTANKARSPLPKDAAPEGFARGSVVLTAARAEQAAREWNDPETEATFGAFTYLFVDALGEASTRGTKPTYGELVREIAARLPSLGTYQEPLLEGEPDRVVFSGALLPRPDAFEVEPLERTKTTRLRGGAVHGLAPGTKLALFERGVALQSVGPEALAQAPRVVVRRADAARSLVEPVDEQGEKLQGEARAALSQRFRRGAQALVVETPPEAKLKVWAEVHPRPIQKIIGDHLDRGAPFAFVEKGDDWDVHVRRVPKDALASCGQKPPEQPVQLLTRNGALAGIPLGPGKSPVACVSARAHNFDALVAQALRAYDARKQLIRLEARAGERGVAVDIAVKPLGESYDGIGCVPEEGSDAVTAQGVRMGPGRCFKLEVTNREKNQLYVSVLVVDPDLSIKHLFPDNEATDDLIPAGTTRDVGTFFTEAPAGASFFKVIATEDARVDTRMLQYTPQDLRSRGGGGTRKARSALERLLEQRGAGLRTGTAAAPERWGSAEAKLTVVEPGP